MKFLDDISLRWKIPLRVMLTVVGTALAITLALLARDYEDMRSNLDSHAKSLGRVLASTLVTPVLHDDLWRAFEILQSATGAGMASPELEAEFMLVLDADAKVFVSSRPREHPVGTRLADRNDALASLPALLHEGDAATPRVFEPSEAPFYFVISPLIADGVLLGHVALGYSKAAFLPRYLDMAGRAAIITVLALLLLLPVSWYWAQRTAEPLLTLAAAMEKIPGHAAPDAAMVLPESHDEIRTLSRAFQRMVDELRRKQELEQQMLASDRLAAVGRLSAGIAHEINNPLGGMLTAIKTYQRHGAGDELAAQTMSLLERGLTQIRNTVAALLVETRAKDRSFDPADVGDVLILVEAETHARNVAIDVGTRIDRPLPLPATLLRQILLNLLLNAIAAADHWVRLGMDAQGGMFRLSVCNDGEHIPEERMAYLFEPFAAGREAGHGLGLWVVYQIVRELDGGITVDSEPGCTTLRVEIPYDPA